MKPNSQCDSGHCRQRQAEYQAHLASLPPQQEKREEEEEETVVHESNEWGRSPVVQYCLCYMKLILLLCQRAEYFAVLSMPATF